MYFKHWALQLLLIIYMRKESHRLASSLLLLHLGLRDTTLRYIMTTILLKIILLIFIKRLKIITVLTKQCWDTGTNRILKF